jgi:putative molybdopterin biosynthesis protein
MDLLAAVARGGSISAAARDLGMSYRHAWGELKRWEGELANPLIIWGKGQSARLTEFGSKLLWAERQAQARLAPQIEALRAELERTFAVAFDPRAHVLSLYASHDEALVTLREFAARHGQENGLHLDIRPAATLDALRALNEGRCIMAALHAPAAIAPRSPLAAAYKPLLRPGQHKIIGFVERTQGLMVAAGNPLRIGSLTDVGAIRGAVCRPCGRQRHPLSHPDMAVPRGADRVRPVYGRPRGTFACRSCPGTCGRTGRCRRGHRVGRTRPGPWDLYRWSAKHSIWCA